MVKIPRKAAHRKGKKGLTQVQKAQVKALVVAPSESKYVADTAVTFNGLTPIMGLGVATNIVSGGAAITAWTMIPVLTVGAGSQQRLGNKVTDVTIRNDFQFWLNPAVTNNPDSDETGILVCASDTGGHGYVLGDYSFRGSPLEWATKAVSVFDEWKADSILVEVNQGGDMVSAVLKQVRHSLPIREIRVHVGKRLRAEPVAAMYEQGRIHHVGEFANLEDQMTVWTPNDPDSPDRIDAMVQAFSNLLGTQTVANYFNALANFCPGCGLPMPKTMSHCSKCGTAIIKPTQEVSEGA